MIKLIVEAVEAEKATFDAMPEPATAVDTTNQWKRWNNIRQQKLGIWRAAKRLKMH